MNEQDFYTLSKTLVKNWYKERNFTVPKDPYVVWMCKTLGNNKALVSTEIEDGRYFEVTYNGAKKEAYLDAYKKESNTAYDVNLGDQLWMNK